MLKVVICPLTYNNFFIEEIKMKFLITFLMLTCPLFAQEIAEPPAFSSYKTYNDARTAAIQNPDKRLFCVFTASWCQPCQQLKADVIFQKHIWEGINKYAIVHFVDVDKETEIAQIYRDNPGLTKDKTTWNGNLPTCFLYSKDTKFIVGTLEGYTSVEKFAEWWNVSAKKDKTCSPPPKEQRPPSIIEEDQTQPLGRMNDLARWLKTFATTEELNELAALIATQVPQQDTLIKEPMSFIEEHDEHPTKR